MPSPFAELARRALTEITPAETIGDEFDTVDEGQGVTSVRFATLLPGYPGWLWTVSVAQVEGEEPTVLEAELLPGESSLVAPDWVPWADRLADLQAAEAHEGDDSDDEDDDESDDDDDSDDDDESDDDESDDDEDDLDDEDDDELDGVDVDALDDSDDDDDDDDDDDSGHDEWDGEDEDPLRRRR